MKKMHKIISLLLVAVMLLLTACQSGNPQNIDGTGNGSLSNGQTNAPTETGAPTEAPTDPAEDELAVFNALFGNTSSWYNKALLCQYTSPAQLKLEVLFYSGFAGESQKPTDAEWAELMDQPGFDINYDLIRLPADKMNQVLTDYFGITLDEIDDAGFDNMVFLESTNCYYHMVTDAMALENFKATAVETQENGAIRVSYTAGYNDAAYVVTLMPNGDGYRILSNE